MYIHDSEELKSWIERAAGDGVYGIDLEFIREKTFYPQLALIQISVGTDLALIDPLGDVDLAPLIDSVLDPEIVKIVHAGSQDMEILELMARKSPRNIFDTQIAASFLGMGLQPSYAAVCGEMLAVHVEKGESWTDWLRRPLTPEQERYALDDVRYLIPLKDELETRLISETRLEWARNEMEKYDRDTTYHPPLDLRLRKVKRSGSLKERGLALLGELYQWREEEAGHRDRPRRRILSDEVLVEIARRAPRNESSLKQIRGFDARDLKRHGKNLLAAVQRGLQLPEEDLPVIERRRRLEPHEEAALELTTSALRALCRSERIAPPLVGRGDDVENLIRDHFAGTIDRDQHKLLCGWRGELIGDRLIELLEGKLVLGFDQDSGFPSLRPAP